MASSDQAKVLADSLLDQAYAAEPLELRARDAHDPRVLSEYAASLRIQADLFDQAAAVLREAATTDAAGGDDRVE